MFSYLRILFNWITLGLILGGGIALFLWLKDPNHFPLRVVEVRESHPHLTPEQIKQVLTPELSAGFFWVNVDKLQQNLKALPWVFTSSIHRIWPDRIEVSIQEHIPLARFNETGILSTEAQLFYPPAESLPQNLPHFWGPIGEHQEIFKLYFSFLERLAPLGLSISELKIADYGLSIRLDNGIAIILGKSALFERLSRFAMVYSKSIEAELQKIAYLDLRYNNGLAIGWK